MTKINVLPGVEQLCLLFKWCATVCCRLVLFRSSVGVTTSQLEDAAAHLEKYMNQRFVHAVVRQQYCQPDEVTVLMTMKGKMDRALKSLTEEGC